MIEKFVRKQLTAELKNSLRYADSLKFAVRNSIKYCETYYGESTGGIPPKEVCDELLHQISLFDDLKSALTYLVSKHEANE